MAYVVAGLMSFSTRYRYVADIKSTRLDSDKSGSVDLKFERR